MLARMVPFNCSKKFILVALVGSLSTPVHSQEIEEVIVTAQRRQESTQDINISMQAFSGEQLQNFGFTDTRDLGDMVPGFTYTDSGFNVPIYTMRGVGFDDLSQVTHSTVGVYFDEVIFPFPAMTQGAVFDVQRVEVLKGPQGTLYGRNTTGGAINFISNKPTPDIEGGVTATYARFDKKDVESYLSGPIIDNVLGRLAIKRVTSEEGWQNSLTRPHGPEGTLGELDKTSARVIFDYTPIERLRFSLTVNYWEDKSDSQAAQVTEIRPQNPEQVAPQVENHPVIPRDTDDMRVADWPTGSPQGSDRVIDWQLDDKLLSGSLRTEWDITDTLMMTWLTSHHDYRSNAAFPTSGLSVFNSEREVDIDTQAYDSELRFQGIFGENIKWLQAPGIEWIAGVYGSGSRVDEFQTLFAETNSGIAPVVPVTIDPVSGEIATRSLLGDRVAVLSHQEMNTASVFAHFSFYLPADLKLTVASRHTREERDYVGCSMDQPEQNMRAGGVGFKPLFRAISISRGGTGTFQGEGRFADCLTLDAQTQEPGPIERNDIKERNTTAKIALDWSPTDNLLVYAKWDRGFKSGVFSTLSASKGEQIDFADQEKVEGPELGIKTSLFSRTVQVNFAAYDYDYEDKQLISGIDDDVFGPQRKLDNAPKSEVKGIELEVKWSPIRGLQLAASGAYTDTAVIEFIGRNPDGEVENFAGSQFNNAAEREFNALASYTWPIAENLNLRFGVDYSYTDKTYSTLGEKEDFSRPSYSLVGASASLGSADERWKVQVWGRNLTNEFYLTGRRRVNDTVVQYTGMPQTAGITIIYNYF